MIKTYLLLTVSYVVASINGDRISNNLLPDSQVCGLDPSKRIVGGEIAGLKEFPWMALLEYDKPNGRGFHCGGSLINKRYVLTAAHCIKRVPRAWKVISVRLGEYNLDTDNDCDDVRPGFEDCADPPVNIPIEEVIVHEQYIPKTPGQAHDIALLRLSREVPFTEYIGPICLPTSPTRGNIRYDSGDMTVAGWGRTENRSQSNIKLKLQVPVKSNSVCSSTYSKTNINLGDGQMCAGGISGKDSCTGDSGGPLMFLNKSPPEYNWYLTAIVSFGPSPCGIKDWPGVYTKVQKYMPWIVSNLKP